MRLFWIYTVVILASCGLAFGAADVLFLQPGALAFSEIYTLREIDPNLTGNGITIASICRSDTYENGKPVGDFAVDLDHRCFADANIAFFTDPCQPVLPSGHSSAIASILVGQDWQGRFGGLGDFYYEGAVPQANLDVYEFWYFLKNYVYTATVPQADVLTMSLGQSYPEWWTRGIEKMAESGIVVVAGIGNGTDAYDPPLYPAAGVNCIGVGVVDCVLDAQPANYLSIFGSVQTSHSTAGPTKEAICKPDIVAPGNCLVPDVNNTYKISGNYSSFAAPVAAGAAALLIEKAKSENSLSSVFDANNADCVIKALLMNSADKLPYWHKGESSKGDDHTAAVDWVQGAGMLNAAAAMDILTSGEPAKAGWANENVSSKEPRTFKIKTDLLEGEYITATLVWKRYFGNEYPFDIVKNTNLKLELWAVDANAPNNKILVDYSDCAAGAVEHIYFAADANYSDYEIAVSFSNPADANQTQQFALAWEVGVRGSNADNILLYDLDNDGVVGEKDFSKVFDNIGRDCRMGRKYLYGDLNASGKIDEADLSRFMQHKDQTADWKGTANRGF